MKKSEKQASPVNINNDEEMVRLGIRPPKVNPRDPSVWSKTEKERQIWRKVKNFPAPDTRWAAPIKSSKFIGRLIVHVRGLDKTTYRHDCYQSDLPYILKKYENESSTIVKAFWNGKEINTEYLLKHSI